MRCTDCGADDVMAVWPGEAGETTDLFRLLPSRPAKGWCSACWQKRYAFDPAPPRSGGKAKKRPSVHQ